MINKEKIKHGKKPISFFNKRGTKINKTPDNAKGNLKIKSLSVINQKEDERTLNKNIPCVSGL